MKLSTQNNIFHSLSNAQYQSQSSGSRTGDILYKERDAEERVLWKMAEEVAGIALKLAGQVTGCGGMPVEIWEAAP
jgi:hypothetical protein